MNILGDVGILAEVGVIDYMLINAAFFVALMGLWSKYKIVPAILLAEFCLIIGFETYTISNGVDSIEGIAAYYYTLAVMELGFFMLYVLLNSKFQAGLAFLCIIYLTSMRFLTKTGVIDVTTSEAVTYEVDVIFATLFAVRLFICLLGVLNGYGLLGDYWRSINGVWRRSSNSGH